MIFVLILGGVLGWIVYQAHVQREAVAVITRSGGGLMYNLGWSNGSFIRYGKPWCPKWLGDLIGVDYFGSVVSVSFPNGGASDPDLVHIGRLARLGWLDIRSPTVTDKGLAQLKELNSLHTLHLGGTAISDAGMEHLGRLTSLEWLSLADTRVSDVGIERLKGLTNLRELRLKGTKTTDYGVSELQLALPNLKILR
jgi:hypothetical protein